MARLYRGINIQHPISELILSGLKTIETRRYPTPEWLVGEEVIMIETPGKRGKFKQRMVAKITFGESFKYTSSNEFYKDKDRHHVTKNSEWAWDPEKGKWGWPIINLKVFAAPIPTSKRGGIVYAKDLELPKNLSYRK